METFEWIKAVYYNDQTNWNIALGALVLMVGFALYLSLLNKGESWGWWDYQPRRRGKAMRRARRDFIRSDTIDALVDHIEKRVSQGDYTRKEAKELYREARKAWEVRDLFPNPELLKENIKRRLQKTEDYAPVPLPDAPKASKGMFSGKPTRLAKA
jgi:hypothetical protein